jgi:multidrug efflux system outer membrane protein
VKRMAGWLLLLVLVASGCKLTPDYERPELDAPESWIRSSDSRESIANLKWWEVYEDEALLKLIERALEENRNLAVALARMEEARYLVTFTRAEQFPFLDVFGSAGRGRQSQEVVPNAKTENTFQVGANLSFEVDLWRKYARGTEAARADLLASEWAYRSVTISLVADVASTYLLLRDYDSRLEISMRTAEGRRDRLDIIEARFEKGTVPQLDVNQAEVQLAIADASVAQFERLVAQTEHALRVLLGQYPGGIERGVAIAVGDWPLEVPAGLPSELLKRRPDVVEAEQRLSAETARIGVAQAMRFPALSLTAQVSVIAEDLTDLNSTDAGQWNAMAGIFQPIFNAGKLKAQMKAQRARAEQTLNAYIGTLQNAFREVEDSLVGVASWRRELDARNRQVTAASNAVRLSQARYDGGVVDYLEVLDSERALFNAELQQSVANRSTLTTFVTLYKALGGGWSEEPTDEGDDGAADEEVVEQSESEEPETDADQNS